MEHWSYQKSRLTYGISSWGDGYFDVNPKGNVTVHPDRTGPGIDMYELVDSLVQRGIEAPVLLRFDGILRDRVARLNQAFRNAILEEGYAGQYRGAYPIKVNQQRHVVDIIREAGRGDTLGLEVGSKPELIAVLAIHDTPEALLLCNGYKDSEYIELALLAKKLGRRSILIIEQMYELDKVLEVASKVGIDAEIGLRMKPVTKGSGRWEADDSRDRYRGSEAGGRRLCRLVETSSLPYR
jgi:arginine decarboxylase